MAGLHSIKTGLLSLLVWVGVSAPAQALQLEVQRLNDNEVVLTLELNESGQWCLHWQHSVAHFLVRDCFIWHQEQLMLSHSHQPDFAAGLDHLPGRGTLLSDGKGGYIIQDINEPLNNNEVVLRVGSNQVDHRIVQQGIITSLSALAAGEPVRIRVQKAPL
ncbi:MAG: DUF1850 domain-containing protein [Saccharospirillum sp.]|nr:DUF1850 domain-containing protein [Saccharospirillum sp.]